jgi:hypothetical protein
MVKSPPEVPKVPQNPLLSVSSLFPSGDQKASHCARQINRKFGVSRFCLHSSSTLTVSIADPIADGPKVINDGLAVPEDGLE